MVVKNFKRLWVGIFVAFMVACAIIAGLFVINQDEQAIVLQFNQCSHVITEPGLHWANRLGREIIKLDKRHMHTTASIKNIYTVDNIECASKACLVYRIANPSLFYSRIGVTSSLSDRLQICMKSSIRNVVSKYRANDFYDSLPKITNEILDTLESELRAMGLTAVDLEVAPTLPNENDA